MRHAALLMVVFLVLVVASGFALAQSGGGYDLTWNTIDNGGGTIGNGGYTLNGTIGQPEASAPMNYGGYTLAGGFWSTATSPYHIFLPLVLR